MFLPKIVLVFASFMTVASQADLCAARFEKDPTGTVVSYLVSGGPTYTRSPLLTLDQCKTKCSSGEWNGCLGFSRIKDQPDLNAYCFWTNNKQLFEKTDRGEKDLFIKRERGVSVSPDGTCSNCTCPEGEYLTGCPGTCTTCGGCAWSHYRMMCSGINPGVCVPCQNCPTGHYASGCTPGDKGVCKACEGCPLGQQRAGCTGNNPGRCSPLSHDSSSSCSARDPTCPPGFYKKCCVYNAYNPANPIVYQRNYRTCYSASCVSCQTLTCPTGTILSGCGKNVGTISDLTKYHTDPKYLVTGGGQCVATSRPTVAPTTPRPTVAPTPNPGCQHWSCHNRSACLESPMNCEWRSALPSDGPLVQGKQVCDVTEALISCESFSSQNECQSKCFKGCTWSSLAEKCQGSFTNLEPADCSWFTCGGRELCNNYQNNGCSWSGGKCMGGYKPIVCRSFSTQKSCVQQCGAGCEWNSATGLCDGQYQAVNQSDCTSYTCRGYDGCVITGCTWSSTPPFTCVGKYDACSQFGEEKVCEDQSCTWGCHWSTISDNRKSCRTFWTNNPTSFSPTKVPTSFSPAGTTTKVPTSFTAVPTTPPPTSSPTDPTTRAPTRVGGTHAPTAAPSAAAPSAAPVPTAAAPSTAAGSPTAAAGSPTAAGSDGGVISPAAAMAVPSAMLLVAAAAAVFVG